MCLPRFSMKLGMFPVCPFQVMASDALSSDHPPALREHGEQRDHRVATLLPRQKGAEMVGLGRFCGFVRA